MAEDKILDLNSIESTSFIDDFIIELMKAGEISGELPKMLSEASLLCSLEADSLLKRLEAMAEPTIILFIGIMLMISTVFRLISELLHIILITAIKLHLCSVLVHTLYVCMTKMTMPLHIKHSMCLIQTQT